jgi:hypothetical protein
MRCAPIKTLTQHTVYFTFPFIMSKSVMLSLLAQGNTGSEILSILDAIAADESSSISDNEPTLNEVQF